MKQRPNLQNLREEIEEIDRRLLKHLKRRMELVDRVARHKLESAYPFRDQKREEVVLQRVRGLAVELGLDAHGVERLYRRIMEMSISRQQALTRTLETVPLRVAYQGVEGSYSHLTAQRRYAGRTGGVLLSGFASVRESVSALTDGRADVALLPIENSTAGSINETYDALAESGLSINAEEISRVEHCLLGLPGSAIEELRAVLSHPQALAQCEGFLRGLPRAQPRAEFDTAGSAAKVRDSHDRTLAAIASESAGKRFGLEVLAHGIQDRSGNATRFVEVALEAAACPPDARCKTSLVLSLDHSAGALGEVLSEFGRREIQLSKLESRPLEGAPWKYLFYLDVEGHADSEPMVEALERAREHSRELRVLGTYPMAEAPAPLGAEDPGSGQVAAAEAIGGGA
ncbi:MAG: prephenate dehydratase [Acidobacteriota bacterium]